MKLYTVGYEGFEINSFVSGLKSQGVTLVADLRKNPVSRKRGFSKRLLGENLATVGIEYIHLPNLGVPTEWRKQAKEEVITRAKMFKDYVNKILPQQTEDLELLKRLMHKQAVALLCFENEAADCHRSFVAQELKKRDQGKLDIVDLDLHAAPKKFKLFNDLGGKNGKRKTKSPATRAARKKSARD